MVARPDMTGDAATTAKSMLDSLFLRWRRVLSAAVYRTRGVAEGAAAARVAGLLAAFARALRSPRTAIAAEERRALALGGAAALAAGSVLSLALARPLGVPAVEAAVATAWTLGWAALRLGILRVASPRLEASDVGTAWAGGLLPWVVAFSDPLRLVALAMSAWLTLMTLQAAGASIAEARRAAAWAFGAEALAFVARWVASGLLLYLLVR